MEARILYGAPLMAAFFCACLGAESDPAAKAWNGIARRSCGPADGPAVEFLMDTLPVSCATAGPTAFRYYADRLKLDSLPKETVIIQEQGLVACEGDADPVSEELRIELSHADSAGISAKFRRIRAHPCKPEAMRPAPDTLEGSARLKICRESAGPLCG